MVRIMSRWKVGTVIGKCKNCDSNFLLSEPLSSRIPIVNDGLYRFHCSNDDCHNSAGLSINVEGYDCRAYEIEKYIYFAKFDQVFLRDLKEELMLQEEKRFAEELERNKNSNYAAKKNADTPNNVIDITKYINRNIRMSVR